MGFAFLSYFDSWNIELPQHGAVYQCYRALWLSSLILGSKAYWWKWMILSLMIPSTTRRSRTAFWWSMKVRNFLYWVQKLREIESTCCDIWQCSLTISVNPLRVSKYLMLLIPRIWKCSDMERWGQKLCDLELRFLKWTVYIW